MYCKHCGKIIDNNSTFCKYCGKKLEEKHKVNFVFTKPKIIRSIETYLKKQYEKYRLFFKLLKKDEMWIFYPLVAIIFIVWITVLTLAIMGGILSLLSIKDNDVPLYYGIFIVVIITFFLFNWFVNFYIKHQR